MELTKEIYEQRNDDCWNCLRSDNKLLKANDRYNYLECKSCWYIEVLTPDEILFSWGG